MANNGSIAYWEEVKHSWSDSLPDPDVIMASDFNGLSNGAEEIKWRNSVARVITGAEVLALYGGSVPSGSRLFFEAVHLALKDTNLSSLNRAHKVKFHLARGLDEQIVTLTSYKDASYEKVDIDYGNDKFGIVALVDGASIIKFRFEVPVTNATEYYYWVECANSVQTIFGGSAYAMTSSETTWLNLANVFAGTLGDHRGLVSHYYDYDLNEWVDEVCADKVIATEIITEDMHVTDTFTAKTISVTEDFSATTVTADVMYGDIVKATVLSTDEILGSDETAHASDIYAGGDHYQTNITKRYHHIDVQASVNSGGLSVGTPFSLIKGTNFGSTHFPLAGTESQYVQTTQRIRLWLFAYTGSSTSGTTMTFNLSVNYFTALGLKYLNGDLDEASKPVTLSSAGTQVFDDGGTPIYAWLGYVDIFDVERSTTDKIPACIQLACTGPNQSATSLNGFLEWESYDRYNV
jgi:hypothetical protein